DTSAAPTVMASASGPATRPASGSASVSPPSNEGDSPSSKTPAASATGENAAPPLASDISTREIVTRDGVLPVVLAPQCEPIVVAPVSVPPASDRSQERPAWEDPPTAATSVAAAPAGQPAGSSDSANKPGVPPTQNDNPTKTENCAPVPHAGENSAQDGPPVWEDIPPDWEAAGLAGQT